MHAVINAWKHRVAFPSGRDQVPNRDHGTSSPRRARKRRREILVTRSFASLRQEASRVSARWNNRPDPRGGAAFYAPFRSSFATALHRSSLAWSAFREIIAISRSRLVRNNLRSDLVPSSRYKIIETRPWKGSFFSSSSPPLSFSARFFPSRSTLTVHEAFSAGLFLRRRHEDIKDV